MQTDVEAEDHRQQDSRQVAARTVALSVRRSSDFAGQACVMHALFAPQQHHHADHSGEQDELLAQRVEAAVVIVDRVDRSVA